MSTGKGDEQQGRSCRTFGYAYALFEKEHRDTRHCKKALGAFKDTLLKEITQEKIEREAQRLYECKARSTVIRNFITPISAVMNFAAQRGLCEKRIFARAPGKQKHETLAFDPSDIERVVSNCSEELLPFLLTLIYTGCRVSECKSLNWTQINLPRRQVQFHSNHSIASRRVPLHPRLLKALERLPHREGPLFSSMSTRRTFGEACREAGVTGICLRSLRGFWARCEFAKYGDIDQLMYRGGWRTDKLLDWHKRMTKEELDQLREAYAKWLDHDRLPELGTKRTAAPLLTSSDISTVRPGYRREPGVWPRLLNVQEAARYCSMSPSRFRSICPLPVVELGESPRLYRYDRFALDEWIDKLVKGGDSSTSDWLGLVEPRHAGNSRQGNQEGPRTGKDLSVPPPDNDTAEG